MKEKVYKKIDDVVEDYLRLTDERIEIPLSLTAAKEKQITLMDGLNGNVVKKGDADSLFKLYMLNRKAEERQLEIVAELSEVEFTLREFLSFIEGNQLAYEKKDDVEKQKITYLFWLEDGVIKCNR
ncbi:MAG: hypothetical protein ABR503_16375 [Chitinophagaceae bacterium]